MSISGLSYKQEIEREVVYARDDDDNDCYAYYRIKSIDLLKYVCDVIEPKDKIEADIIQHNRRSAIKSLIERTSNNDYFPKDIRSFDGSLLKLELENADEIGVNWKKAIEVCETLFNSPNTQNLEDTKIAKEILETISKLYSIVYRSSLSHSDESILLGASKRADMSDRFIAFVLDMPESDEPFIERDEIRPELYSEAGKALLQDLRIAIELWDEEHIIRVNRNASLISVSSAEALTSKLGINDQAAYLAHQNCIRGLQLFLQRTEERGLG